MKTTLPLAALFALVMGAGIWLAPLLNFGISLHVLLDFHIAAICLTGLLVLYADEEGLAWMLGKKARLSTGAVRFLHYAVALGLGAIIISGSFLFLPRASIYLAKPDFIVKMLAVAMLIINTHFIDRFSEIATKQSFRTLPHAEHLPLFISGAISVLGWGTTLIAGLLLNH